MNWSEIISAFHTEQQNAIKSQVKFHSSQSGVYHKRKSKNNHASKILTEKSQVHQSPSSYKFWCKILLRIIA